MIERPLNGAITLVAGATRGAGRGIACMLGEAGATVICTGRSVRGHPAGQRRETIDETAEMVTAYGGQGIAIQVDHTVEPQVVALCERVRRVYGRLDVLVNDIWGGEELSVFGPPFWKLNPETARQMWDRAVYTHILTSRYAVPLMLEQDQGLIVEITDGDHFGYRGSMYYDLVKMSVIRLAFAMAVELRRHPITSLAVTPGFLRSEEMLDHFGVTEANWRDATVKVPHFIASETPYFVGRAVAALAADPNVHARSGRVFSSWDLSHEYGFTDIDGSRPDWGAYFAQAFGQPYPAATEATYETWRNGPIDISCPSWPEE